MSDDKKFHWFPFYYLDWMTDLSVQMLTHSEKGLYIDMLCSCFNEDGLPTDHKMLERLFKCDADSLKMVVGLFHERDGKLHNKKLDKIKSEQAELAQKKSLAGKKSAQARKAKSLTKGNTCSTPVQHVFNSVATEAQHNPTSTVQYNTVENTTDNIVGSDDPLVLIWSNSPKAARERSSRKQLKTEWGKVKDKPGSAQLLEALNSWNLSQKWQDGFAEGIHRWVKNEGWYDLPAPKANPHDQNKSLKL